MAILFYIINYSVFDIGISKSQDNIKIGQKAIILCAIKVLQPGHFGAPVRAH